MGVYLKDPRSRLDYAIDWSANLDGSAIAESQWEISPAEDGGLRATASFREDGRTQVTLEGGVAGQVYRVANIITRGDGRQDARSLIVRTEAR